MRQNFDSHSLSHIPCNLDPNIYYLDCIRNNITNIENLDNINLRILNLYSNRITKIHGLNMLINLTWMSLSYNKITKIENLDKLVNLQQLFLHDNEITKIENLDKLVNLQYLDLHNNQITKMQNLDTLINLQEILIYGNPIKDPIISLQEYKKYIKNIKIQYELEWCDYYMIIAIINEKFIDIYRMYFVEKIDYILKCIVQILLIVT